jgi:hypothetical protein
MKNPSFLMLSLVALGLGACGDDPEVPVDLSVPTISNLESASEITPSPNQIIPSDWSGIRYYFKVTDPEGISEVKFEVKGDFPNQSQSGFHNSFELLNHIEIHNKDSNDPRHAFTFGSNLLNFDPHSIDWGGTFSVTSLPILAGPYDLFIDAKDVNGNTTSSQDGTGYQTTIFVERYYAPLIHRPHGLPQVVSVNAGEALALEGGVMKTEDALSTPLKFIWIKLADKDVLGDYKGDTDQVVYKEQIWGQSLRLEKSGIELPSATEVSFNDLFQIDPMDLPAGKSNLVMIVWAEDEAGNVSRKAIPIDIK